MWSLLRTVDQQRGFGVEMRSLAGPTVYYEKTLRLLMQITISFDIYLTFLFLKVTFCNSSDFKTGLVRKVFHRTILM